MMTIRFPDADRIHAIWEDVRAFARERLCRERNLAVIAAFHLPVQIGSTNPPHVHLMALARELKAYGFADFVRPFARSEEHTSELQSLMRILYAVFCLKNKTARTYKKRYDHQV